MQLINIIIIIITIIIIIIIIKVITKYIFPFVDYSVQTAASISRASWNTENKHVIDILASTFQATLYHRPDQLQLH